MNDKLIKHPYVVVFLAVMYDGIIDVCPLENLTIDEAIGESKKDYITRDTYIDIDSIYIAYVLTSNSPIKVISNIE